MTDHAVAPTHCTCFALRRLTRTVSRLYDLHLAKAGLKTTQYSLLRSIAYQPQPMSILAARLCTERTTLTRTLKPLLEAGHVKLTSGADARQRIVTITDRGRAAIETARLAWKGAQAELERTLGVDTVRALHEQADSALNRLTPLLEGLPHAHDD